MTLREGFAQTVKEYRHMGGGGGGQIVNFYSG